MSESGLHIVPKSPPLDANQLIVSRKQACAMLGNISVSTLRRLMKAGRLHAVPINSSDKPRRSGKLYFDIDEVKALIPRTLVVKEGGSDDA
jgi:hypothetical protein